jgi:hypothetical protein
MPSHVDEQTARQDIADSHFSQVLRKNTQRKIYLTQSVVICENENVFIDWCYSFKVQNVV